MLLRRFSFLAVLALAGLCAGPTLAIDDQGDGQFVALAALASGMLDEARRLEDLQAIGHLQHAYGYYVDKQQWEDVRDLFARDAMLEPGGRGRFLGQDHIYEYLRTGLGPSGPVPGKLQDHLLGQGIISISPDGNAAKGRWSALVAGGTSWSDQVHENSYVKEDGVWKLASVHTVTSMHASAETGWGGGWGGVWAALNATLVCMTAPVVDCGATAGPVTGFSRQVRQGAKTQRGAG
jgi:hypothetical protein